MFSLVISIIAIAIAAVLIFTTANYGGDSMNDGTVKAQVSQYKNEAHQISSTLTMYKVEKGGFVPCDINGDGNVDSSDSFGWDCLVQEGYLKKLPQSTLNETGEVMFSWGIRDNVIFLPNVSDDVCITANRVDGYQTEFSTPPTNTTVFGPNGETSGAGFHMVEEGTYLPNCGNVGDLSDRVPCCYDGTSA